MNNTENIQFTYKIKRLLDAHLSDLPTATTAQLATARKIALARKKESPRYVSQIVLANTGISLPSHSWLHRLSVVAVPLIVGVLLFSGLYEFKHQQQITELANIDVAVLSDELPLSAYLDHGFNAYLAQQDE